MNLSLLVPSLLSVNNRDRLLSLALISDQSRKSMLNSKSYLGMVLGTTPHINQLALETTARKTNMVLLWPSISQKSLHKHYIFMKMFITLKPNRLIKKKKSTMLSNRNHKTNLDHKLNKLYIYSFSMGKFL